MVIPSDCHIFGSGSRLPHVFQPSNIRLVRTIGGEKNSWVSSAEFFVFALDDLMVGPAFGPFCAFVRPFPNLVFGQKGSNATFTLVRIGALQWNYWSVKFSLLKQYVTRCKIVLMRHNSIVPILICTYYYCVLEIWSSTPLTYTKIESLNEDVDSFFSLCDVFLGITYGRITFSKNYMLLESSFPLKFIALVWLQYHFFSSSGVKLNFNMCQQYLSDTFSRQETYFKMSFFFVYEMGKEMACCSIKLIFCNLRRNKKTATA